MTFIFSFIVNNVLINNHSHYLFPSNQVITLTSWYITVSYFTTNDRGIKFNIASQIQYQLSFGKISKRKQYSFYDSFPDNYRKPLV